MDRKFINIYKDRYLSKVTSYITNIENEYIVDYVIFQFKENLVLCLMVNSTAEGISISNEADIMKEIKRTKLEYNKAVNIINEKLIDIELIHNSYDDINSFKFLLKEFYLEVKVGMDCLKVSQIFS